LAMRSLCRPAQLIKLRVSKMPSLVSILWELLDSKDYYGVVDKGHLLGSKKFHHLENG
jgi:hypothetical protein